MHFPPAPATNLANLGAAPAVVADHATVEWPEPKSKARLITVALIAVAGLAAVGFVVLGNKDEPLPPITAAPPLPAAVPTPTGASESARASDQPGSDTASGSDPVAAAPPSGSGFAEMFAAGARKAESQGAKVAPSVRFDPAATKAVLAQAANEAQACKQAGGPTGKVTVVVTFDPSGKVSSATINDPPVAGTPTATCITQAFKRVSMAPFSGLPGTVSKTFSIL